MNNEQKIMTNLNKTRLQYKFPSKEFKTVMKKQKTNFICKLELNTCKFYMLKSRKYLKKNIRILNTNEFPLYKEYTNCLLKNDISNYLKLRNLLESYDKFIEEIDFNLSNLDFDTNLLKVKYNWNDIEINFYTNKKKEEFINKKYIVTDRKYNNQLITKIINLENIINLLKKVIRKDNSKLVKILDKINLVIKQIDNLKHFLEENLVESNYLVQLRNESTLLLNYYNNLIENKPIFKLDLVVYEDIKQEIENSKLNKNIRNKLVDSLKKFFESTKEFENVPFLPEFYDIAYDYIKYPMTDKNIEKLLEEMNI